MLDLVLLRRQVLLVVRRQGTFSHELVAAVDAIGGGQGGGQDQPQGESASGPSAERARQDVRGVRPEVGPHVIGQGPLGQLLHVGPQAFGSVLGGPPGEIGVALSEADLGQAGHHLGPGERFGQQDDVGMLLGAAELTSHSQKANGLVCGLSTLKIRHRRSTQKSMISLQASHSATRSPSRPGPEVEGIDVLVLLGRVLGVGDGPVGAVMEPLGMLADPGMVGRAVRGRSRGPAPCRAAAVCTR